MTVSGMPPRSSTLTRYGPLAAIGTALVVLALVTVVTKGEADTSDVAVADVDVADLPPIYEEAEQQGLDVDFGERCDPQTGQLKVPTAYAPPCVPVFTGDNGGATSNGVTADEIKVGYYAPQENGDVSALLLGVLDKREDTEQTVRNYVDMFNEIFETYGRRVVIERLDASGAADDEVAARNDAVRAADNGYFAVVGGPALNNAFSDELASRGVLCIECGQVAPDSVYQHNAPFMWGSSPTPEEFMVNVGDYIANRLLNRPAEFAGDPAMREQQRVFGTVHLELDPPVYTEVEKIVLERGKERGFESKVNETYLFDIARAPERAPTIIAKMKEAGVTTIIFLGDPLMPIYLTQAATAQNYFPEWVVTGTAYTDTTVLGRMYDQQQWAHAFGLSNLPVRMPRSQREAWKVHEWWYGAPPPAETTAPMYHTQLEILFLGIHMAGPDLTPQTFKAGMAHVPARGGGPTLPQISFGDNGYFENLDGSPRFDFLAIDDITEIWWDPEAEGFDESERNEGKGMWRYVDGGRRYRPGEMPSTEVRAFELEGSVLSYDTETRPPEDRAPAYPPWPGSPTSR